MARDRRDDLLVAAVPLVLVLLTLVVWLDPDVAPALINEPLDLVLNAAATLVAVAVAILAWIHHREGVRGRGGGPGRWLRERGHQAASSFVLAQYSSRSSRL